MKCFCEHRWPWFGACPECQADRRYAELRWAIRYESGTSPHLMARDALQRAYNELLDSVERYSK